MVRKKRKQRHYIICSGILAELDQFNGIVAEQMENTTFHIGHPYLNSATLAGAFRVSLKKYDAINNTSYEL